MQTAKHLITHFLESKQPKLAVSIYMPTHPKSSSQSINEDTARLKNAIKNIKQDASYNERELGVTMGALHKLVDDTDFWKYQTKGLAIFADKDGYEMCHLPYEVTEYSYIQDRFIISPLAVMQSIDTEFYVLDINATNPRLLVSTDSTLEEVKLDGMPDSFQKTSVRDGYETGLQNMNIPKGGSGDRKLHGQSVKDTLQHDMSEYLVLVARTINDFLSGTRGDLPLLLIGEQSRVGNLRPHLKYTELIGETFEGNFEIDTPQELFNATAPRVRVYYRQQQNESVKGLISSMPELVADGNEEIAKAAEEGKVKRMYVPAYEITNDSVRADAYQAIIVQLPDDILELESITRDVLLQGGEVQAMEIDLDSGAVEPRALLRFP